MDCKAFEEYILSKASPRYKLIKEIERKTNKCFICGEKSGMSDICPECARDFPIKKS